MEVIASGWSDQESIDELKGMLLYTTFELELARNDAREEMRRIDENIKDLLHLLKVACQERDEAKDQLRRLLNNFMPSSPTEISPVIQSRQHETLPMYPTKGNPSITQSDSPSETYNHHSYSSSPIDSFFDVVSSPDLSNRNLDELGIVGMPHQLFTQEYKGPTSMSIISSGMNKTDQDFAVIDELVKEKPLPQKGRLLQTVMEAGPLLQTLLVSGPLPQWRNPPPLQPFHMPSFSINVCDPETINQQPVSKLNYLVQNCSTSSYPEISTLDFTSGSGTCLDKGQVLSVGVPGDFIQDPMRQ